MDSTVRNLLKKADAIMARASKKWFGLKAHTKANARFNDGKKEEIKAAWRRWQAGLIEKTELQNNSKASKIRNVYTVQGPKHGH